MTWINEVIGPRTARVEVRPWIILLFAVGGSFLIYGHLLGLSFFGDDFRAVWRAGLGTNPGPVGFFRPLSDWSIRLERTIFGNAPQGYRAFNILVHGLNAFLLIRLGQCLITIHGQTLPSLAPFLAGLLFLCYPFHNEAILWIVGRGASMATLFTLLALWALTTGLAETWKPVLTASCMFVGLLAYESAFLLPLLALPILMNRRVGRRSMVRYAIYWGIAIVLHFALRQWVSGNAMNDYGSALFQHPWKDYLGNVPKVLGRLLLPPNADSHFQLVAFGILALLLVIVCMRLWHSLRDQPDGRRMVLDLMWMLAISALVAVIVGVSTRTSESDRFLYMPSAFLCLLIALTTCQLLHGPKRWTAILFLLAFSLLALQQNNMHWAIASRIVRRTLAEVPQAPLKHRLFITGIPADTCGAYIFRNGFYEAMLLAGKDTARMVIGHHVLPMIPSNSKRIISRTGDTLTVVSGDAEYRWTGRSEAKRR